MSLHCSTLLNSGGPWAKVVFSSVRNPVCLCRIATLIYRLICIYKELRLLVKSAFYTAGKDYITHEPPLLYIDYLANAVIHLDGTPVCASCKFLITQLSCSISLRHAPFWSKYLVDLKVEQVHWGRTYYLSTKMAAPVKRFIFFVFVSCWSF